MRSSKGGSVRSGANLSKAHRGIVLFEGAHATARFQAWSAEQAFSDLLATHLAAMWTASGVVCTSLLCVHRRYVFFEPAVLRAGQFPATLHTDVEAAALISSKAASVSE